MIFRALSRFEHFGTDPRRLLFRGTVLLGIGASLAAASVLNPNASLMHASDFSWLPAASLVLLAVGLLESFDAAIAKEPQQLLIRLPVGLMDLIVGTLALFSISGEPNRLNLMLAAFLINKGVWRLIAAQIIRPPNVHSAFTSAWASVVLGLVIGIFWPHAPAWFLSFCLSADIGLRGWALMRFAFWLKAG